MNEHQIKCFLAVRKHLNFSCAAKQLYVTQPALTYQILKLEQELGVRLFDRTTTSVNLTKAGAAFAVQAEKLSQQYLETVRVMREYTSQKKSIVLACPHLMMMRDQVYKIMMSRIIETFPHYDIEVFPYRTGMQPFDSLSSRIDCIIGMKPFQEEDSITYSPLFQPQYYIVVDPQHILAGKNSIAPGELAGQTVYYESEEQFLAERLRHLLERMGIPVTFKKVKSYDTVYPNFLGGNGIFISPVIYGTFPQHLFIPLQTDDTLPLTVLMCLKEPYKPIVHKLKQLILQLYQEYTPVLPLTSPA